MGGWVVALVKAFEIAKVGINVWEIVESSLDDAGLTAEERAEVEAIIARGKAQLHDTSRDV